VPPAAVVEPARVAVLDHGRHTSLLLEVPGEAAMVRYAYGDWRWYALGQTGVFEGIAALSGNKSALGRKRLPGPLTPETVPRRVTVGIEEALYLDAEARDVRRLVATLDGIFAANTAERIDNTAYGLEFVPHPEPYGAFNNSNQMVARWLEALGCRVDGSAVYADWKLARPR
jgi:hypothetical protein